MIFRLAAAVVVALLAAAALGQAQTQTRIIYVQTQTVTNAVALSACTAASTPANCSTDVSTSQLFAVVETNAIRWFANGTAPTSAVGNLANAGATITIQGHQNIVNFRMIATAGNATVTSNVSRP